MKRFAEEYIPWLIVIALLICFGWAIDRLVSQPAKHAAEIAKPNPERPEYTTGPTIEVPK